MTDYKFKAYIQGSATMPMVYILDNNELFVYCRKSGEFQLINIIPYTSSLPKYIVFVAKNNAQEATLAYKKYETYN